MGEQPSPQRDSAASVTVLGPLLDSLLPGHLPAFSKGLSLVLDSIGVLPSLMWIPKLPQEQISKVQRYF